MRPPEITYHATVIQYLNLYTNAYMRHTISVGIDHLQGYMRHECTSTWRDVWTFFYCNLNPFIATDGAFTKQ